MKRRIRGFGVFNGVSLIDELEALMCKRASGEFGSWGAEPRWFSGRLAVVFWDLSRLERHMPQVMLMMMDVLVNDTVMVV